MSSIALRALGHAIAGSAAVLLATAAITTQAQASSDVVQPRVAAHAGWGAGPVVVTLIDVARGERPIAGKETGGMQNNVAVRPVAGSLPIPEQPRLLQTPMDVSTALAARDREVVAQPLLEVAFSNR